jgi:hypothetical protein
MRFLGLIHFEVLENESVVRFSIKIAVARENSANFDFLTKTAHFQQLFKNVFRSESFEVLL